MKYTINLSFEEGIGDFNLSEVSIPSKFNPLPYPVEIKYKKRLLIYKSLNLILSEEDLLIGVEELEAGSFGKIFYLDDNNMLCLSGPGISLGYYIEDNFDYYNDIKTNFQKLINIFNSEILDKFISFRDEELK